MPGKTAEPVRNVPGIGLGRIYMGLESGHDPTLAAIGKGADAQAMIKAGRRVRKAGIFLSVTCLLGIAGQRASLAHARATAEVLSAMRPNLITTLTTHGRATRQDRP